MLSAAQLADLDRQDDADRKHRLDPWRLAKAALWYAQQGLAVFPIQPDGKRPLIPRAHANAQQQAACKRSCGRDGHGLLDATTDVERVKTWWRNTPDANIATPTGASFDCYDVDGPLGVISMWAERKVIGCYADTIEIIGHALTIRDGGHHLLTPPAQRGNGTNVLPGVDYRGAGGYILIAPSKIADREYSWLTMPDFAGLIS